MSIDLRTPPSPWSPDGADWSTNWIGAAGVPADALVVGVIDDDEACYSFDDWVLAKGPDGWYLAAASGCSCPSHEETARLEVGPASLADVRAHIASGEYHGYTLPVKQREQFDELFRHAEAVSP